MYCDFFMYDIMFYYNIMLRLKYVFKKKQTVCGILQLIIDVRKHFRFLFFI